MNTTIDAALVPLLPVVSGLPRDLASLAAEIHADNIRAGWWKQEPAFSNEGALRPGVGNLLVTQPRNVGELLALIHSEISEADEGYQADLMDDKLPHRRMAEVEFADTAIRVLDVLGFYGWTDQDRRFLPLPLPVVGWFGWTSLMHRTTTRALEGFRKGDQVKGVCALATLLGIIHFAAIAFEMDLTGAIAEKRAFNAIRLDHKIETREAIGGKAF